MSNLEKLEGQVMSLAPKERKHLALAAWGSLGASQNRGEYMNTKELINEAVALPVEERALLVDSLLRTLNQPESNIDKKWAVLARKRLVEMRSGKVRPVPGEDVFERIRNRFDK